MKKKATKQASARGKKSKLKDLAPKADPKAGLNFAADVNGDRALIGNTGFLVPAVKSTYNK